MANPWTNCSCGHEAQAHNRATDTEHVWSCDHCDACVAYDGHRVSQEHAKIEVRRVEDKAMITLGPFEANIGFGIFLASLVTFLRRAGYLPPRQPGVKPYEVVNGKEAE